MGWAEALVLIGLALVLVVLVLVFRRLSARPSLPSGLVESLQADMSTARREADTARAELAESRSELAALHRDLQARPSLDHERAELDRERDDLKTQRRQLDEREQRLGAREARLDTETQAVHDRSAATIADRTALADERTRLDVERDALAADRAAAAAEREAALADRQAVQAELSRAAGLTSDEARAEVLAHAERDARLDAAHLSREIERQATSQADQRAREILVTSIQRLASEQTAESVVTALDLPSEDMKGRIIGREGRNIRAFEQITGVNVLIDDTPEVVLLSAFDPVRRETARLTLQELVADGRIHPQRIEEVHERSERAIAERVLRAGEDALLEVGITDLHPDLVPILGSLRYRTSYGQNVLKHLIECAHLAAMMAAELGLDPTLAKRGAFLHDIGKALTHSVEGSHALIGADLARSHGEHPDVVHAIEAHHNEVEPRTVEALLTQAADSISGSRPAARRESLEAYVQRLEKLESLALAHEGVDRVFAMQAGREVRVMVLPDVVNDDAAHELAKSLAREITQELTFPGQIRVTVVRESRATEIAH